jgi:GT2 family glycosyltransferase
MSYDMKFVFVILHYKTIYDTIECVNSILKNESYSEYEIVIVDNCSPGDDFKVLSNQFSENNVVHLMRTDENLGFAKGNNVGYLFAKKELKTDFVILMNNDTVLEQKIFLKKILEIYEKKHFAILGPDIISLDDGEHQNPHTIVNLQNPGRELYYYRFYWLMAYLGLYVPVKRTIFTFIKWFKGKKEHFEPNWRELQEGGKLYGACLIFSPEYVSIFNGLYDKTFMYVEEDILYYIARKENLKMVYSPEIQILHKEKSSTQADNSTSHNMRLFFYSNMCRSLKVFLVLIKNYKKERRSLLDD